MAKGKKARNKVHHVQEPPKNFAPAVEPPKNVVPNVEPPKNGAAKNSEPVALRPKELPKLPPIKEFYNGRTILFIGEGGVLGKLLTLKLLKACPGIKKIYFLMYIKPYINELEVEKQFLNDPIFKESNVTLEKVEFFTEYFNKIDDDDIKQHVDSKYIEALKHEVSIIFYISGSSYLERRVLPAFDKSYYKVQDFVQQLHSIRALEAFIYVSTAFSDSDNLVPEEEMPVRVSYKKFCESEPDLKKMKSQCYAKPTSIAPYKTISVYAKKLGEEYLGRQARTRGFPIGIFRPGMLTATVDEPRPGYVRDNNYLNGTVLLTMYGYLHKVQGNPDTKVNLVPIDMAVNAIVVCACDVAIRAKSSPRNSETSPVFYNFVTTEGPRAISWKQFERYLNDEHEKYQSNRLFHYWSKLSIVKSKYDIWLYNILNFFPYVDLFLCSNLHFNRKTNIAGLRSAKYQEDFISYLSNKVWKYENENVCSMWDRLDDESKVAFDFVKFFLTLRRQNNEIIRMSDIRSSQERAIDTRLATTNNPWPSYFANYVKGMREYVLVDEPETDEYMEELRKYRRCFTVLRFIILVYCIVMIIFGLLYYLSGVPELILEGTTFRKIGGGEHYFREYWD